MLVLRDPAAVEIIGDPGLRQLVARRFAEILAGEVHDRDRHGIMIVVEPADTVDAIEEESGFAVLRDFFDEVGFGDPEFQPAAAPCLCFTANLRTEPGCCVYATRMVLPTRQV